MSAKGQKLTDEHKQKISEAVRRSIAARAGAPLKRPKQKAVPKAAARGVAVVNNTFEPSSISDLRDAMIQSARLLRLQAEGILRLLGEGPR